MRGAFLDVDGVIRHNNRSKVGGNYYNIELSDVQYIEGAIEAHKLLYNAGYNVFWITMQNSITEGKTTLAYQNLLFNIMRETVNNSVGANVVKDFKICTTESEDSQEKIDAKLEAVFDLACYYDISFRDSFGCGDCKSDVLAFKQVGIGTVVHIDLPDLEGVYNDHCVKEADGIAPDLITAVQWLLARGNDINSLFVDVVNKLTGREYVILNDPEANKCFKILQLFKGRKSSCHHHLEKTESFKVIKGVVKFTIDSKIIYAYPGSVFSIDHEVDHSFEACSETALIFEESTYHKDSDTIRLTPSCRSFSVY